MILILMQFLILLVDRFFHKKSTLANRERREKEDGKKAKEIIDTAGKGC